MDLNSLRKPESICICEELGVDVGGVKRKPHLIDLIRASDVGEAELVRRLERIGEREKRERCERERERRELERSMERERCERERRMQREQWEWEREMERMDHKIKQMRIELASVRQAQALASVEAVTEGACRGERKAEAENIELTEEQQHSSDSADNVPGKFEPNRELLEVASEQVHEKGEEETPQALDGCFSEDEGNRDGDDAVQVQSAQERRQEREVS